MNTSLDDFRDRRYLNCYVAFWGLTYWFAALLQPDLVGNVPPLLSAAGMVAFGAVILGNLVLDSRVLWAVLAVTMTAATVASWVGLSQWTVPYETGTAAVTMAAGDAATALVFFLQATTE